MKSFDLSSEASSDTEEVPGNVDEALKEAELCVSKELKTDLTVCFFLNIVLFSLLGQGMGESDETSLWLFLREKRMLSRQQAEGSLGFQELSSVTDLTKKYWEN